MKIACDLDDTICDFVGAWLKEHNHLYRTCYTRADIRKYSLAECTGISQERFDKDLTQKQISGFYKNLCVYPYAGELLREISQKHTIYIVTNRFCARDTLFWLVHNSIPFENLFLTHNKESIYSGLKPDVVIDDCPAHVESAKNVGVASMIFDQPWNENVQEDNNLVRVWDWRDIYQMLK